MKKVYRYEDNETYWDRRWSESGADRDTFNDLSIYPIKYAELVMRSRDDTALEIGCGLGRILKHYARQGFRITGIERSAVAVERLVTEKSGLDVQCGDVLALPYATGSFNVVMAFGVYHNLENGIEDALRETARVLRPNGRFAISMRPDNLEMNLNEIYWRLRNRKKRKGIPQFHKLLVSEEGFKRMLSDVKLHTEAVHYARNVSTWYRFPLLRDSSIARGSEGERRAAGYRLNAVGRTLDRLTSAAFPYETANVLVFVGHKLS